jgi:sugar phosphate isomerase/epimerase
MSNDISNKNLPDRRSFLKNSALAVGALATGAFTSASSSPGQKALSLEMGQHSKNKENRNPTRFIHACMTLGYSNFPLERALTGIKSAGFDYVAWGTQHLEEDGERHPVMPMDAHPDKAAELGRRCRDLGLEPVKMFSTIYPDNEGALEVLTNRVRQAEAAGIQQVLTFGPIDGGDPELWVRIFKELGPIAADHNVTVVMKQHGGETTGTGEALAKIVKEVDHPNIWMSYDAGNVFWYEDVDPNEDIKTCAGLIRGFCLKDGRYFPAKAACGPGYGTIDHYELFSNVAFSDHTMIVAYENIHPPYVGRPESADGIDQRARFAREFMENVINGVQST